MASSSSPDLQSSGQTRHGLHVHLDADMLQAIDALAVQEDRPRVRVIRELIKIGLATKARTTIPNEANP